MQNRLNEMLHIEYPLIQGGMAWVADCHLASAVSNAGGLGLIAGGSMPGSLLREQIRRTRAMTDRTFGVNIMLMSPFAAELAQVVIEEQVPVVTTGAGSPGKYMDSWKATGICVIPVVASVAYAKRMERIGADAVVAEGTEAGGHIGETSTMVLVPQVADAVSIPVVAAGGIADGRGVAAALMLGAEGVQLGTRFLACAESMVHENYKQLVVKARDIDTRVTGRSGGHPVRALKTRLTRALQEMESKGATFAELEAATIGSLRKAVQEGDVAAGTFMAGQSAGLIRDVLTAEEIVHNLFAQATRVLGAARAGWLR